MYGLEKKQKALFEFDLERELKEDSSKKKELISAVESNIQEIKDHLRKGASSADFEDYGVLLHGYTALQKVVNKISKKTK